MVTRTNTLLLACLIAMAVVGVPSPVEASAVPLLGGATTIDTPSAVALESVDEVRKAEARAKARLEALEKAGETPSDAPAGTPPYEISDRLTLARQLVSLYDKQLNTLARTAKARERRAETEVAQETWPGFDQPPPRSVLLVDTLRDELDAARNALAQAEGSRALFERLDASYASKVKAARADARLAGEAADRARGRPSSAALDWQRDLATLRADVEAATQALVQMGLRGAHAEQEAATVQRDFARRKLIAAGSELALPRADLDKVLAEIESRRIAAGRDLERATRTAATAQAAVAAAERRLAAERAAPAGGAVDTTRLRAFESEVAAVQEGAATANQRVYLLREHLQHLHAERLVWDARATALDLRDPVRARAAHDRLTDSLAGLRATKEYQQQQLTAIAARVRDEEARQRSALHEDTPFDLRLLDALRERENDLRKALDQSQPLERLVAHFRADFEGRRDITATERAKDVLAGAWLAARQAWNYEMFTIDDSLETSDGRKVVVSRSVTVGKTFGALLIVVLGYLLCSVAVRWIERKIVRSGRTTPQAAALVRKWILFVMAALLAIIALVSASIPLTAFAFLGGALAIAAGFGLQTLLKNLVSGVMLLVERPLRLGDLVEVDGIRGRVTEIGIRASTIRSVDGIESMIPNSRFIEGNMTNWTYTTATIRQTISVGVAYGSPLRTVTDLLTAILDRHGLVLKDPAPQVYLDEYGDSSINISLTYWVEMNAETDARRVKSDLLHMIDSAFAEAGISIPFPQRDVRFSTEQPVPVAIVPSAAQGRAAA